MKQNDTLHATIVSPERTLFDATVDCVLVPGELGQFEVLVHHAPIISSLTAGEVVCRGVEDFSLSIQSGFIEVKDNVVTLCVEVA